MAFKDSLAAEERRGEQLTSHLLECDFVGYELQTYHFLFYHTPVLRTSCQHIYSGNKVSERIDKSLNSSVSKSKAFEAMLHKSL